MKLNLGLWVQRVASIMGGSQLRDLFQFLDLHGHGLLPVLHHGGTDVVLHPAFDYKSLVLNYVFGWDDFGVI